MRAAIVIPIYKTQLLWYEKISLNQCFKILKKYPIIFIAPQNIDFNYLPKQNNHFIIRFPKECFTSISTYNKLMLDVNFYQKFIDYDYILMYQLDAFVFSDQLEYFCSLNYDYIGAPWPENVSLRLKDEFNNNVVLNVGNGGFSLRKVKNCINILLNKPLVNMNEDMFFSYCGKIYPQDFSVAPIRIAYQFSWDFSPERYLKKNKYNLSFGCHGWHKYSAEFYVKLLSNFGYDLNSYRNMMGSLDISETKNYLMKFAFHRLVNRINNRHSIARYIPKNKSYFICVIGKEAKLLAQNIGNCLLIISADCESLVIKQLMDKYNNIVYGKDYFSFLKEYIQSSIKLLRKLSGNKD